MNKSLEIRVQQWLAAHPRVAFSLLVVLCIIGATALFLFAVFSDFSSSADFVYNSF